jgi:hypothetical protein
LDRKEFTAIALKEAEKMRKEELKMSGLSMEFKGIDNGTGIHKCAVSLNSVQQMLLSMNSNKKNYVFSLWFRIWQIA